MVTKVIAFGAISSVLDLVPDLSLPSFWWSALFVLGAPLGWNILGRIEHYTRFFTQLFKSKFVGCYVISAYIFTFSLFRNYAYEVALTEQVTVKFDGGLALTQVILGYLLAIIGGVLVVSSSWALGIIGTYNGDYFDILMEERITQFPFSVLNNPMYVGSTTLFLSRAVLTGSPAGLVLTAWVWLVYRVGCWFEEPFTSFIYEQAALRQELAAQEDAEAANDLVIGADIESWSVEEVVRWLDSVSDFEKYSQHFKKNHIDGSMLCRLDHAMLEKDLHVTSLGHRFKIMDGARERRDAFYRSLERSKGNKWISQRKRIENRIKETFGGKISEVTTAIAHAKNKLVPGRLSSSASASASEGPDSPAPVKKSSASRSTKAKAK